MFEPVYGSASTSSSKLILGENHNIGIITLWTKSADVARRIDKSRYAVMGQFFSAERGLDLMVRNLLANPQITNLVITGIDFSRSGQVLRDFFEKGFYKGETEITGKPVWRVNSEYPGYIGLDIPEDVLNELKESINVTWITNIDHFNPSMLPVPGRRRQKRIFMKREEEFENRYVAEDVGFVVKGKKVAEVWLKILDNILKFGKETSTHYEDNQKEILNLISVITDEYPNDLFVPEWLPFDKQHFMQYIPQITTAAKVTGTAYTYGQRIREWFGLDQVKGAVAKLVREPNSRAVVINLWDSTKDLTIGGSPCVNHIWLRIRDGRLFMTVTIRSNDMFEAYPDNAFGLRCLQEIIRNEVNAGLREKDSNHADISLGDLIINSQSAHVYRDSWERASGIVGRYLHRYVAGQNNASLNPDPRGNFVVSITASEITVDHLSTGSELIGRYRGKTASELIEKISKENLISVMGHAMDIGLELARAEVAMKLGIEYVQEVPLDLSQINNSVKSEKQEQTRVEERMRQQIPELKPVQYEQKIKSEHMQRYEPLSEKKIIIDTRMRTRDKSDDETYVTF